MIKKIKKTVFVGVSGGVDSSVSAILLKNQGYNVVGVFIRTWTPDFIECSWQDERRDAMRVCASINIPFLECDAEDVYKKEVVDYMIMEYKNGNTPNPDVMCNRQVKFGVFWDFAKKHGADFIATGHYTRNSHNLKNGNYELKKGLDQSKDQSYFLWTLTQGDLKHVFFPVGHLQKKEVRNLAKKYDIPVFNKKDSQGICFLGPIDIKDFLKHYIKPKKGSVLNLKGEVIGYHDGAVFFTLGERHGFTITEHQKNNEPLYVIFKDISENTITVSPRSDLGENKNIDNKKILCNKMNWINVVPEENKIYDAQIRYHGKYLKCEVEILENNKANILFSLPVLVSAGQSIVIYDGNICLGGGVIE